MSDNVAFSPINTTPNLPTVTRSMSVKRQHDSSDQQSKKKQQKRKKKHHYDEDVSVEVDALAGEQDVIDNIDEEKPHEFDLLA